MFVSLACFPWSVFLFFSIFWSPLYTRDIYSGVLELTTASLQVPIVKFFGILLAVAVTLVQLIASWQHKNCSGGSIYSWELANAVNQELSCPSLQDIPLDINPLSIIQVRNIFSQLVICFLFCLWYILFCKNFVVLLFYIVQVSVFSFIVFAFWVEEVSPIPWS